MNPRLAQGLRDAFAIGVSYWRGEERGRAAALLVSIAVLNVALVGTTVLFTYWQGAFYNALEAKDWHGFLGSLLWWRDTPTDGFTFGFAPVLAVFVVITVYELYLHQALQIRWRRWMTSKYVGEWLANRAYFRMALTETGPDNPDQRIAEDIRLFVDSTLSLGLGLLRAIVSLASFVVLLWSLSEPVVLLGFTIHGYLVWVALLFGVVGTWLAHLTGQRLTPLHFVQQRAEADFRFGLMRLRENAEGVAFYRGEAEQERELSEWFAAVVRNWREIMTVTVRLTLFTTSYAQVMLVFPLIVVAPAYFAGRMALGGIFQISNAFVQVQNALSWVVTSYADLTGWLATVERLAGFRNAVAAAGGVRGGPDVVPSASGRLELANVRLARPDGRGLMEDVDLTIARGDRLLIRGVSGAGKSTLLRAIAGLWPFGAGTISRPDGRELFTPQRPYLPLGSLKRVVCYPLNASDVSDERVAAALNDVGLGHLAGELATTDVWDRRLSGGEQQRVALARSLLVEPQWLYLDEATSGLDSAAEAHVYALLRERLPSATVITIGHRPDLTRFHDRVLDVTDGALRSELD